MTPDRFQAITESYPNLRIAVLGDFCLDRYLEIDPAKEEISLETRLPVYNVMNLRAQPGGAGTIVNNLAALGIGSIFPIGFAGMDGEGFELWHALEKRAGVRMQYFVRTELRRTFTYCKPLVLNPGKLPVELNRLDLKNWTPTPSLVQGLVANHFREVVPNLDAAILLEQVDLPETGVLTSKVLEAVRDAIAVRDAVTDRPELLLLADSRRGCAGSRRSCSR